MKYIKAYVIFGIFVAAAFLWKGCGKDEAGNQSVFEESVSKKQRVHRESPKRSKEIREYVERGNVSIKFYGKVIDERGSGLEGVSIGYRIQRGEALLGAVKVHSDLGTVMSGANGMFEISKRNGSSLALGPFEKDGYRDAQHNGRSFGYMGTPEPHKPDNQKPVEFVMVKDGTSRTKEIYQKRLRFAWNQGDVRIPLGKNLGDFVLTPTRVKKDAELRSFDWNIKVSMDRAELASLGEHYAPIAPDTGYHSSFEYGTVKGDDKRPGGASKTYAFKTTDGLYGLVRISVYPDREDFVVNGSLNVRLNESGSRNLD